MSESGAAKCFIGTFLEKFRIVTDILLLRKSYNPSCGEYDDNDNK